MSVGTNLKGDLIARTHTFFRSMISLNSSGWGAPLIHIHNIPTWTNYGYRNFVLSGDSLRALLMKRTLHVESAWARSSLGVKIAARASEKRRQRFGKALAENLLPCWRVAAIICLELQPHNDAGRASWHLLFISQAWHTQIHRPVCTLDPAWLISAPFLMHKELAYVTLRSQSRLFFSYVGWMTQFENGSVCTSTGSTHISSTWCLGSSSLYELNF